MPLSSEQIESLFAFTKKKLVHWYDLQVELVDHLAARIEEEMDADPKLNFENALQKVYAGFGIFGFSKIVQQKQEQLERGSRKMWWNEMLSFFKWPKFMHLAFMFAVLWQLASVFDTKILTIIFVVVYIITSWVLFYNHKKAYTLKKNLLLLQFGPTHISSSVFFYEVIIISNNYNFTPLVFAIFACTGILIKIVSFQIYKKVKEQAVRLYPEAFV
jgi:hypothetical protein